MNRRFRQLRAFWQLPLGDRAGLLAAWGLLLSIDALCWLMGARCCLRWLRRAAGFQKTARPPDSWVICQAELVSRAARHTPRPTTCLIRAMALWFLLTRRGVACDIILGVQKKMRHTLEAHAWVEWKGRPLLETADVRQRYAAFERPLSSLL
ncbi:MAG: hypothetical protein CFK52_07020 [Chloracidobacterium sp. CP2_5A]|nr:MAG: hypothetical protein CFK52_07020 [Chloracidobacterium sp. CP2_5A]